MRLRQCELAGAFIVEPEPAIDERGFFARLFCRREFEERGLTAEFVQSSISFNRRRGTLRGLHFQVAPREEVKLVRCTAGAIFDVIVDLRPDSRTRRGWTAVELSAHNRLTLYVPRGFAHGFQTLTDDAEVLYQISELHSPEHARGIRWNDPALGIAWPLPISVVSKGDQELPTLGE